MGREDLHIGSAPADEDCAQLGSDDYRWRAWHECRAFIGQLRRYFGPEPPGCRLYVRENPHDFGIYLSVNCACSTGDQIALDYGFRVERELPALWDAEARAYLAEQLKPRNKRRSRPRKAARAKQQERGAP